MGRATAGGPSMWAALVLAALVAAGCGVSGEVVEGTIATPVSATVEEFATELDEVVAVSTDARAVVGRRGELVCREMLPPEPAQLDCLGPDALDVSAALSELERLPTFVDADAPLVIQSRARLDEPLVVDFTAATVEAVPFPFTTWLFAADAAREDVAYFEADEATWEVRTLSGDLVSSTRAFGLPVSGRWLADGTIAYTIQREADGLSPSDLHLARPSGSTESLPIPPGAGGAVESPFIVDVTAGAVLLVDRTALAQLDDTPVHMVDLAAEDSRALPLGSPSGESPQIFNDAVFLSEGGPVVAIRIVFVNGGLGAELVAIDPATGTDWVSLFSWPDAGGRISIEASASLMVAHTHDRVWLIDLES